jgi:chemotaxis protein MotB
MCWRRNWGSCQNKLAFEGHTDSKRYAQGSNYGNGELSADRANAARRLMVQQGIQVDQVTQVRGFAHQKLRKKDAPLDPANRRISLIVQYVEKKPVGGASPEGNAEEAKPGSETKPKESRHKE